MCSRTALSELLVPLERMKPIEAASFRQCPSNCLHASNMALHVSLVHSTLSCKLYVLHTLGAFGCTILYESFGERVRSCRPAPIGPNFSCDMFNGGGGYGRRGEGV